jgi:two-component system, NarL family, sensor histidine kinase BarA
MADVLPRIRHLRIPLAAKLQILYGVALVLIIGAALMFPWWRMEDLMVERNELATDALVDQVVADHIASPAMRPLPTTRPADDEVPPPRLVSVNASDDVVSPFERRAISVFQRERDRTRYGRTYEVAEGLTRFRYARPLYFDRSCAACHQRDGTLVEAGATPVTQPTTGPRPLLGIVSVDIESKVLTSELLLNRAAILTAAFFAACIAVVTFYRVTTQLILKPVRVLQETAEKVSAGNLNIRSDISTGDEFQQLSETINTMLTNLKNNADQLRAINKSLDLKLGQLAESNVALYESNRLKSEFLANVSHELRTPLNSILGFAELLKDTLATPESKSARYVQNILQSGKNLLELINDLLDLAKIEAGRMEVRSEPLSLSDLFEGLGNILKPLLEGKTLNLDIELGTDVPVIETDPPKLQQILYNFLSNAIKFSPPSSEIDLRAERIEDGRVRISVTDQGPGIDPEKHAVIFEKFRQLDASHTREHSGTGLGLAISRELAGLLKGEVGVHSEPGKGATFWLILPPKIEATQADVRANLVLN